MVSTGTGKAGGDVAMAAGDSTSGRGGSVTISSGASAKSSSGHATIQTNAATGQSGAIEIATGDGVSSGSISVATGRLKSTSGTVEFFLESQRLVLAVTWCCKADPRQTPPVDWS